MVTQTPTKPLLRVRLRNTRRQPDPPQVRARIKSTDRPFDLTDNAYRVILNCQGQPDSITNKPAVAGKPTGRRASAKTETFTPREEVKS